MSETTPNAVKALELEIQHSIARNLNALEFLQLHRNKLEALNLKFSHYSNYIDFDSLSRPELLNVLKTFGGKWDKRPGYDGGITYQRRDEIDGRTIRCYNAQPPASCKIVETVKWVKVPARREKQVTRTVVCK